MGTIYHNVLSIGALLLSAASALTIDVEFLDDFGDPDPYNGMGMYDTPWRCELSFQLQRYDGLLNLRCGRGGFQSC